MQHIQQLTMTWLRPPARAAERQQKAAPPELPDRARVRRVAEMHHRQLLQAKQRTGSHYDVLRAQTEALRQFTLELSPEQVDTFMNMYTEESSAVERRSLAASHNHRPQEPLNPTLVNTLTFAVTIVAIAAAIYSAA
jgi:hypothetical protein